MTEQTLKVVDLGTKLGNAIVEFVKRGDMYFGEEVKLIQPNECLGIDRQSKFSKDLTGRGLQFMELDITAPLSLEKLPQADYYLAWDFLEHLPSTDWSSAVVHLMLHNARRGVWLRMPSFEQDDETGEGVLRKLGLRFAWTNWVGHPSHYTVLDAVTAVNSYCKKMGIPLLRIDIRPGKLIRSTEDPNVVPVEAPIDTVKYSPALGVKTVVDFDPPVVGQWEVIIKR